MKKKIILLIFIAIIITGCSRNDVMIEPFTQSTLDTTEQPSQTIELYETTEPKNETIDNSVLPEDSMDIIIKQYYDFVCKIYADDLFEADLADFDGDGEPELIVIAEVPGGNPDYGYYTDFLIEIYKYVDGSVALLDSVSSKEERCYDFWQYKSGEIYLTSYKGKDYICFDNYSSHQGGGSYAFVFLTLGDNGKLLVEFSYGKDVYEEKYFGKEYDEENIYEDLDLPEYTSILRYDYIEEYEFYLLKLVEYWINDLDTNIFEYEYEELAREIETHRDIWNCSWNWGEKGFNNFTCGERLKDYLKVNIS